VHPRCKEGCPRIMGTSNGTFQTKKVGDIEISFVYYSGSKRVHLKPDIVKYACNGAPPAYNLILGLQTLHDLGVVLDFKEGIITIDEILLPMRNINNLQLKTSISRALKLNTSLSQEPASTRGTTKHVVEILDAKYAKADLPAIVRENCKHLNHQKESRCSPFCSSSNNCLMALWVNGPYCLSPSDVSQISVLYEYVLWVHPAKARR
jgi:hypothetical protein